MPRPPSRTGLNSTTQRELVWWLAKGLPKEEAAKRAGLPSSARLYHFSRTQEFAAALREAVHDRLSTEIAPRAVSILDEIMSDTAANPRVRVDAAKALIDRAGYAPRPSSADKPGGDDLTSMSRAELQRFVFEGEKRIAEMRRSRLIEGEAIDVTDVDAELTSGIAEADETEEPDRMADRHRILLDGILE